jgi:hypothetical protein
VAFKRVCGKAAGRSMDEKCDKRDKTTAKKLKEAREKV